MLPTNADREISQILAAHGYQSVLIERTLQDIHVSALIPGWDDYGRCKVTIHGEHLCSPAEIASAVVDELKFRAGQPPPPRRTHFERGTP